MIWFVLACTQEPEPTVQAPPTPEVESPAEPEPEPLATQEMELPPGVELPWPEALPCEEFASVQLTHAWLSDPEGKAIVSPGHETARFVSASRFTPETIGQIHPHAERAHLQAECADPRESLHWVCQEGACTLEVQRIAERPTLPSAWANADFSALAGSAPSPSDPAMKAMAVQGKEAMTSLLRGCQAQQCSSQDLVARLEALSSPSEVTLRQESPWKLAATHESEQLILSCTPQSCQLQVFDAQGYLGRLDVSAEATSVYVPGGGRLDYRDSRNGPRVVFTGSLSQAPASP